MAQALHARLPARAAAARRWRLRRVRIGLRDRVTIGFGLLALALSTLLAVVVGLLVTHYLLAQRRDSALLQTAVTAAGLQRALAADRSDIPGALDAAPDNDRTSALLYYGSAWYTTSLPVGPNVLPDGIVKLVGSGTSATQRIAVDGDPYLAVGTPLDARGDAYFELFSLSELDRTYRVLSITLVAAALATGGLGLVVGRFASGRVLRPLAGLTEAASAVAAGDLDARLEDEGDPDTGELARSFNRTTQALKERVVAELRFAADVSHELRTPLTTMLNSMAVLQNHRGELPAGLVEPLDLLGDDLARFRKLVVDLLELSRDEDEDSGASEPIQIAALVEAAARATAGPDVPVRIDPAARLRVLADKRRLERVVVDLVENANAHGGGCIGVDLTLAPRGVRLTVDDAGPGIPADQRSRVFERFAKSRTGSPSHGVGLGLAIVARHVRWHGGTITVTERPGGGARFVVELPLRRA